MKRSLRAALATLGGLAAASLLRHRPPQAALQVVAAARAPATGPRFAYAFVVSGCDGEGQSCLGYLLNALAAAHALRNGTGAADVLFVVQMLAGYSRLPRRQEEWLSSAGVRLEYLNNTASVVNFGMATLNKFRILEMAEYDRVLFLDADILPLCTLEYMFQESYKEDGLFEPNVVMEGNVAPITASMFLLTPKKGEFRAIMDLIREYRSTHNDTKKFDKQNGWGHPIAGAVDRWHANGMRKDGYHWDYKAAHSDQGLLHHWIKYMRMNYTQLKIHSIQTWSEVTHDPARQRLNTWGSNTNNITAAANVIPVGNKLLALTKTISSSALAGCGGGQKPNEGPPYNDHIHYAGPRKPWKEPIRAEDVPSEMPAKWLSNRTENAANGRNLWLYHLGRANWTFALGLDARIEVSSGNHGNPFGAGDGKNDLLDPRLTLPD